VRAALERLGVPFTVSPRLVRGLDYYRRTTFEVLVPTLGAQNALLGGGRYDGLVQELGGPATPGFGFAIGEDRLVMSLPESLAGLETELDAFLVVLGEGALLAGLEAAARLRAEGRTTVLDPLTGRSLRSQMRRAHDLGARFAIILGEEEVAQGLVTIKKMADGTQTRVPASRLAETLTELAHA